MISIIITCHNLEKYIGAAIESVLNQNYSGHIEILVVDDKSSDNSAKVIAAYPSVNYIRTDSNVGVLMATVIGIENTTGDYVFFLDGDDVWEPCKISRSMAAYVCGPACNLVTHDLRYIDHGGAPIERNTRPEVEMANLSYLEAGFKVQRGILLHTDYVWLGSAFSVHRIKADLAGFCVFSRLLPDTFNTYQDWPLAYWAAIQPNVSAAYVPEKLFRYRLHGANYSGDSTSKAKAVRNFRRTLNTMEAIQAIAIRFNADAEAMEATRKKLLFCQYCDDLYAGRRIKAIYGFFPSVGYLAQSPALLLKETIRLTGITLLGVDRFIAAMNQVSRMRRALDR